MNKKRRKNIFGIAIIALGVLLLLPMVGGMVMRRQLVERVRTAEGIPSTILEQSENETRFDHHHGRFEAHRGRGGFGLIGRLVRLAALGTAAYLLYRLFKRRHDDTSAETIANDIRVGDEINDRPADQTNVAPEDMSVDDLVAAMKRLGIKKLEL